MELTWLISPGGMNDFANKVNASKTTPPIPGKRLFLKTPSRIILPALQM
jgi:hypothetical protein